MDRVSALALSALVLQIACGGSEMADTGELSGLPAAPAAAPPRTALRAQSTGASALVCCRYFVCRRTICVVGRRVAAALQSVSRTGDFE